MHVYTESISREQFESLQKDIASLQKELNYWQNTTISILKKYLLENEGILTNLVEFSMQPLFNVETGPSENHCAASDDSYIKNKLEKLDHNIDHVHNFTEGKLNLCICSCIHF
jgi:hypothetical protein